MLEVVTRIANSVNVPVSADVEAGYGPSSEDVALTIRGVIEAGAVGANIEDSDKLNPGHLIPFELAVKRIGAGRAAADVGALGGARTHGTRCCIPAARALCDGVPR